MKLATLPMRHGEFMKVLISTVLLCAWSRVSHGASDAELGTLRLSARAAAERQDCAQAERLVALIREADPEYAEEMLAAEPTITGCSPAVPEVTPPPSRRGDHAFAISGGVAREGLELRLDASLRVRPLWIHVAYLQASLFTEGSDVTRSGLAGVEGRACSKITCLLVGVDAGVFHSRSKHPGDHPVNRTTGGLAAIHGAVEGGQPRGPFFRLGLEVRLLITSEASASMDFTVGVGLRL